MGARMRLVLATVDGAADGGRAVVVEHQVGMAAGAVQPALDPVLRCRDGCAHGSLSGLAVGVGRRAGDAALPFQAFAQLAVGLAYMLAENVAAGGFVLAEVADRAIGGVALGSLGD